MVTGQKVISTVRTAICEKDEHGVCFEEYDGGYQIIFENGGYCGYGYDEMDMLVVLDDIDAVVALYEFTNVIKLTQDYKSGHFDSAFKQVARKDYTDTR